MPYTIDCTDTPDEEVSDRIRQKLVEYNTQHSQADNYRELVLYARDEQGELVGGLLGCTYWGWLTVDILWVREDARGQGLGARLLQMAEAEALRRGCRRAHLDTLDFQAPDFYLRRGYTVWGVLEDLPPGHKRIFLRKELAEIDA